MLKNKNDKNLNTHKMRCNNKKRKFNKERK